MNTSLSLLLLTWLSSIVLTIELFIIYEFVIKPIFYHFRLKRVTKQYGVTLPAPAKIFVAPYFYGLHKTSKGTYIIGAYYPELKRIDLFCGKKDPLLYYSTLFHEFTHWSEDQVGRVGISLQAYILALDKGDTDLLKFYFLNELIAERSSEYICKHYFPRAKVKHYFRARRNNLYFREVKKVGLSLTKTDFRHIILEAKYSSQYIINYPDRQVSI